MRLLALLGWSCAMFALFAAWRLIGEIRAGRGRESVLHDQISHMEQWIDDNVRAEIVKSESDLRYSQMGLKPGLSILDSPWISRASLPVTDE